MRAQASNSTRLSAVGLLLLVFMTASLAAEPAANPTVTPAAIRQLVQEFGAKEALQRLAEDSPRFHSVLRGIGTATPEWLKLAEQLLPASDGFSRDMMVSTLAAALEAKPDAVLRAELPLTTICAYDPLTPISRRTTRDEFLRALKPREVALAGVTHPELRAQKELCLGALAHLRETSTVHQ